MSYYFGRIFTIEFLHNYYTNRVCSGIRLEPTEECGRLLKGNRLLFKETSMGGQVVRELKKEEGSLKPIVQVKEGTAFVFKILLDNPFFWNITDVELEKVHPASVFVFENSDTSPVGADGTVIVHSGRLSEPVRVSGKVVKYSLEGLEASTIFVYDRKDRVVFGNILKPEEERITIDMTGCPEGLYRIKAYNSSGAMVKEDSVFITADSLKPTPFGFVVVRFTSSLLGDGRDEHTFRVEFSSREINWTYRINLKTSGSLHNIDATKLKIVDAPVRFSKTVSGTGAERLVEFTSETPIELKEEPYRTIKLVEEPSAEERRIILKTLPNPDVRRLIKDDSGLKSIIYLTIK